MIALAIVMRTAWAILVPIMPISDSAAYDALARNLAAGRGYVFAPGEQPTAFWPVGTSFMYSLVYRAFGGAYAPITALNVILGVALVAATMALAGRWFGPRIAGIAGLLMAVWPIHVQFSTIMASETPFTLLVVLAALAWPTGEHRSWGRAALAGALLAAACYVRPTALLLPAVLAGVAAIRTGLWTRQIAIAAIAVLVMGACIAPWTLRNTREFGQVVLISTNRGTNLWMGNNPDSAGTYQAPPPLPGLNEAQSDAHWGDVAKRYILDHPGAFVVRTASKLVRLHASETIGVGWNEKGLAKLSPRWFGEDPTRSVGPPGQTLATKALKSASTAYWLAVLAAAIVGVGVLMRRDGFWGAITHPALVLWAYFAMVHAVIVIQDRYHFPSSPMIAALAAVAVAACPIGRRPQTDA